MALRLNALPLLRDGDTLVLALADALSAEQQHLVRFVTECRVVAVLALADEIQHAIQRCYAAHNDSSDPEGLAISEIEAGSEEDASACLERGRIAGAPGPIVRLVNNLLADAVSRRASDIHIRPGQKTFEVLFRINGTLVPVPTTPRALPRWSDASRSWPA